MARSTAQSRRAGDAAAIAPPAPNSLPETGLALHFVLSLMCKAMYLSNLETPTQLRDNLKLSGGVIRFIIQDASEKGLIEVRGRAGETAAAELRYALTAKGREWATEALELSQYVGPAPITLPDYYAQVDKQRLSNEHISRERLKLCLDHLVLADDFISRVGPAINSARSLLLYGPPGNGKTSVAEAVGDAFDDYIYIPYCIEVDGQIIKLFDETVHVPVEDPNDREAQLATRGAVDRRWVLCRRPVVLTGGELSLEMLDLNFNPYSRFYEAPMQLKATGGVFIIDDFGRQMVSPIAVLNRWIIPLERHMDYLSLHTGKKFPVPFDELVIFSTNIQPKDLMDAATMRRIQYKLEVAGPTFEEYESILIEVCNEFEIALPADLAPYLKKEFYEKGVLPIARYHPRWIVEHVISRCDYEGIESRLERRLVVDALRNLYTAY